MKKIPFEEFVSAVHVLLPNNLDLIKFWNDHAGISYDFTGNTLQVNTRLLEPLKDVVPTSLSFKDHTVGTFKISQVSMDQVIVEYTPEVIIYHGDYKIRVNLYHVLISVDQIIKRPVSALTKFSLALPYDIKSYPIAECIIDSVSKATLDKLHRISRSMQSKRTEYFQDLITGVKDKQFMAKNLGTRVRDQFDFINIFEQSLMELNSSNVIVFTSPVHVDTKFFSILWYMMDASQSIKMDQVYYQRPYGDSDRKREYVLGWKIRVEINNW